MEQRPHVVLPPVTSGPRFVAVLSGAVALFTGQGARHFLRSRSAHGPVPSLQWAPGNHFSGFDYRQKAQDLPIEGLTCVLFWR